MCREHNLTAVGSVEADSEQGEQEGRRPVRGTAAIALDEVIFPARAGGKVTDSKDTVMVELTGLDNAPKVNAGGRRRRCQVFR